jgi:hypothetical protein
MASSEISGEMSPGRVVRVGGKTVNVKFVKSVPVVAQEAGPVVEAVPDIRVLLARGILERVGKTPEWWDRDCRVCMTVGDFSRREMKGVVEFVTIDCEEVHAWHTEEELVAFMRHEEERRRQAAEWEARQQEARRVREAASAQAASSGGGRQMKRPSLATLERWAADGVAKATDGCRVEPDGTCPHGCESWILRLGF